MCEVIWPQAGCGRRRRVGGVRHVVSPLTPSSHRQDINSVLNIYLHLSFMGTITPTLTKKRTVENEPLDARTLGKVGSSSRLNKVKQSYSCLSWHCPLIFVFWFFSWIGFLQAPEYTIRTVLNFFQNSRRYSQLKVHHWCQVEKTFNHKSFNNLIWTPLESRVNS
jgi:hypothetical protein